MNPQLLFPLIGFVCGIGIASWPPLAQIFSLLAIGLLLPLLGLRSRRWRQYVLVGIVAAVMGLAWALFRQPRPAADDIVHFLPCSRCQVMGVIKQVQIQPDKVNLRVRVAFLLQKQQRVRVTGLVQVFLRKNSAIELPPPGAHVLLVGTLEKPLPAMNFGAFSYRDYLARQGIFTQMRAHQLQLQQLPSTWHIPWLLQRFRHYLYTHFARPLPSETAPLLGSLILGEQAAAVSPHVENLFARAGLQHVLAVSGFQVQLLVMAWMGLACHLRLGRAWIAGIGIFLIALYMALTGFPASVLRAGVVASLGLWAWSCFRNIHPMQALVLGGALLVCWRPSYLYEPGFQFSFLATAGLIWGANWLADILDFLPLPLAQSLGALLAAQIWVLPVQLYHFGEISWLVIPANLWALLFVSLLTWMSVGGMLLALVLPTLWHGLAFLLAWLSSLFIGGVQTLASWPFPVLSFYLSGIQVILVLSLLFILPYLQHFKRLFPLLVCTLVFFPLMTAWREHKACPLRVTYLYVGQGDAILIEKEGRTLLLDAGPRQEQAGHIWDAGARYILPYLRRRGIHHLDMAVISHAHVDHYGGFISLLEAIPIKRFWVPADSLVSESYLELLRQIHRKKIPVDTPQQGQKIAFDSFVELRFWQAQVQSHGDLSHDLNNQSLVLQLRYQQMRFLFAGDIEIEAETALLSLPELELKSEILKIPHHGSDTSSSSVFLEAVQPREAIASVGIHNRFGHPVQEILERYRQQGVRVWRTDQQGAICICTQGTRYHIQAVQRSGV